MRRFSLLMCALVLGGVAAEIAAAHNNNYAFRDREVRARQAGLRWVFNRTFPDWGPHDVRCTGQGATTMRDGSRGWKHIRCRVESMNVPDFIYHVNGAGKMVVTRAWS